MQRSQNWTPDFDREGSVEIDANFDYVSEIERDVLDQKMGMNFINLNLIDYTISICRCIWGERWAILCHLLPQHVHK